MNLERNIMGSGKSGIRILPLSEVVMSADELRDEEERTREAQRIADEKAKKRAEQQSSQLESPSQAPPASKSPPIVITPNNRFWTINNVPYQGGLVEVDLARDLIDNGSAKTQDEWAKYSMAAKKRGKFYTPNYPLFYNILRSVKAGQAANVNAEEIRSAVKDFSRNWLMTLTRIKYNPSSPDLIVHNNGLGGSEEWFVNEDFVGDSGEIKSLNASKELSVLVSDGDVDNVKEVFQWLNGTDSYLYRINSRPEKLDERVVGFVAGSDWVGLYCDGNPSVANSSLGVCVRKKFSGGSS